MIFLQSFELPRLQVRHRINTLIQENARNVVEDCVYIPVTEVHQIIRDTLRGAAIHTMYRQTS